MSNALEGVFAPGEDSQRRGQWAVPLSQPEASCAAIEKTTMSAIVSFFPTRKGVVDALSLFSMCAQCSARAPPSSTSALRAAICSSPLRL
jgi:hypothetical protein